jgi:hypothetical protein
MGANERRGHQQNSIQAPLGSSLDVGDLRSMQRAAALCTQIQLNHQRNLVELPWRPLRQLQQRGWSSGGGRTGGAGAGGASDAGGAAAAAAPPAPPLKVALRSLFLRVHPDLFTDWPAEQVGDHCLSGRSTLRRRRPQSMQTCSSCPLAPLAPASPPPPSSFRRRTSGRSSCCRSTSTSPSGRRTAARRAGCWIRWPLIGPTSDSCIH